MKTNVQFPHPNIQFYDDGNVHIDMNNIYTRDRLVYPGQKLMLLQDSDVTPIEIVEISHNDKFMYLNVTDLNTWENILLSNSLDDKPWGWAILSLEYVFDVITDSTINKLKTNGL